MPGFKDNDSTQTLKSPSPLFPRRPIRGPLRKFGHLFGYVTMGEIKDFDEAVRKIDQRQQEFSQRQQEFSSTEQEALEQLKKLGYSKK